MNKVEKVKDIINKNYPLAWGGIFNNHEDDNTDPLIKIYNKDELTIYICFKYNYIEVIGLNAEEFRKIERFYNKVVFENIDIPY